LVVPQTLDLDAPQQPPEAGKLAARDAGQTSELERSKTILSWLG
jgi:hypothetical protein